MKKLLTIFLLLFTVSLFTTSCKDDDDSSNPADLIVGSWQFVSSVATECTNPADNESDTCTTNCEITIFTKDTVTFAGDTPEPYSMDGNKITFGTGSGADTYELSITGSTLTVTEKEPGDCKRVTTLKKV
ncbi:MAG: hypothetical protein KF860_12370 [Cyclobacteriaceae bacterium]|nr:hypothetical protein [Cyclobacteriaceae bacterium]